MELELQRGQTYVEKLEEDTIIGERTDRTVF